MAFGIDKFTDVLVRSVNIRAEMHGEEPVPAIDIGLRLIGSNNILLRLDPVLKGMLYRPAGDATEQRDLDGIDPASDMPELRSTVFDMPIPLKVDYTGYSLVIDYGLGGKSNIRVGDCEVNNFKVDAKEGGSVEIDFRVQAVGLEGAVLGQIGALVRHDVRATLIGPSVESESPAASQNPFKFTGTERGMVDNNPPPEAGDIFAATHAPVVPAAKKVAAKKVPSFKTQVNAALKAKRLDAVLPAALHGAVSTPEAAVRQKKPTVQFRDSHTGSTWSGRGKKPKWLELALANGHTLEEFAVEVSDPKERADATGAFLSAHTS